MAETTSNTYVVSFSYTAGIIRGLRLPGLNRPASGVVTAVRGREVHVQLYRDVDTLAEVTVGCAEALEAGLTPLPTGL